MKKTTLTLSILLLTGACQGPPEQELESAQEQIDRARKAQAEVYAPEMLRQAEDLLSDASLKISEKSYSEAQSLALDARKKAEEAEKSSLARLSTERENGSRFASETRAQLEDLKTRVSALPREGQSKQQSLSVSLQELEGLVQLFVSKLESGKLNEARNVQMSLQQKLEAVRAALDPHTESLVEGAAGTAVKSSPQRSAKPRVKSPPPPEARR